MKSGGGKDRRKRNMASKAHLPSKEKKRREPSSDNEDEESEEVQVSAGEENYNLSGEKAELDDLKMAKSGGDTHEVRLDSDSDGGSPYDYELRHPISETPKSSSQRVHDEKGRTRSPTMEVRIQKTGEGAKTPGGRVWSDNSKVTLLREMVAFRDAKGRDPSTNFESFYDSIKGKLEVEFSKDQVKGKIRRMRNKFFNALESSKNGEGLVLSNPHGDNLFELSKKIWGIPVGNTSESIKKGEKQEKNVYEEEKEAEAMGTKKNKKVVQEIKDIETGNVNGVEKADVSGANAKNFELKEGGPGQEEEKAWKKLMIEELDAFERLLEVKAQ